MSETFRCDDKEMLVAYLYGEIEPDGRREVERHLRTCPGCTREVDALQHTRLDLQAWEPPDADLGFTVVPTAARQEPAPVLTSSRWSVLRELPAWAQVAAAVLVLGVGAAIANLQVRSTSDGFVVTTGWMTPAASAAETAAAPSEPEWRRELVALEQSLRNEIAAQQAAIKTATTPRAGETNVETAQILRRVQAMIEASEERQRQEVALRLTLAERSWNQRQLTNLAAINQRMSTLQGRTFAVEAGQQEMLNRFLRRVSVTPNQ